MRHIILFILLQTDYLVSFNVSETLSCCPSGYLLHYDESEQIDECKDVNSTNPLRLSCQNISIVTAFGVLSDREIALTYDGDSVIVTDERACIGFVGNSSDIRELAIICNTESDSELMEPSPYLGYCMAITALFLLVTTVIYCVLYELRDLQGKIIINLCGSLAIGLLILSIIKLIEQPDVDFCAASFFVYFFVVATFFWTTAMSVQVLLCISRPETTDRGWKDLLWYTLFAWGSPMVLTILVAIVNYYKQDDGRRIEIVAETENGMDKCRFFETNEQQWKYMHSIMLILLAVDIATFIYVGKILWRNTFASSHVKTLKHKFFQTVRLTALVSLPWIFEMISSFNGHYMIRVIVNVFITLQGPLVFLQLVVFRRRAIKAMYKRGCLCCMKSSVEQFLSHGDDEENQDVQHTGLPVDDRMNRS